MITFLVNLDKDIDNIELTKLYFYPYLKEQKIKIINSSNKTNEDIFNEIKYYIYNSSHLKKSKKEFQLLFIVPICDKKNTYFNKNLTNRVLSVKDELLNKLLEERLEADYINFITIDDLERDFRSTPMDVNAAIAEELDKNGYTSAPIITFEELSKIEIEWKNLIKKIENIEFSNNNYEKLSDSEKDGVDNLKEIYYIIDDIIKNKIEFIEGNKIGAIDDSAIRSHIKKYDLFKKRLKNDLEHDFKMRVDSIKKSDIKNVMLSILKREEYYYEYLFNEGDISKLSEVWNKHNPLLSGEEQYNLSKKYIEDLKSARDMIEKTIEEIVRNKVDALNSLSLKANEETSNIYLDRRTIKIVGERFKDRFIKKKLDVIIENKSLKEAKLVNAEDILKDLLKESYSLERASRQNNYKIFRIPFEKKNTLEFNKNLLKLSYFMLFLVEYAENKENYIYHNRYFHLQDIKFKKNYNNMIFDRYIEILLREKNRIEAEKKSLKSNIEIDYYSSTDESLEDLKSLNEISKVDFRDYKTMFYLKFYPNDIDSYYDWIEKAEKEFSNYIDKSTEALFDYQSKKNRFLIAPKIKKNLEENILIEQEVSERKNILDNLRKELGTLEEKVEIDIKNEWIEKIKGNVEVNPTELKSLLQKRPANIDILKLLLLSFIQVFIYGYYKNIESTIAITVIVLLTGLVISIVISIMLLILKSKIKDFLNICIRKRNSYESDLTKKIKKKKEHIDKEIEVRIAEKNYQLAKRKEENLNEQQELLEYYKNQIDLHCQNASELKRIMSNIGDNNAYEIDYLNETFNVKLKEIDYKKIPFENDKFNPTKYIEIPQYKDLIVYINQQETAIHPQNLFGCHSILLNEDKIYSEAVI
ncbi:MAG: hypothetical protein ACRC0Y_10740 [Fusobacteriaceae bacterium]